MEIKFRGKRTDNGEWVIGDYHQLCKNPHIHTIGRVTHNVIPETVGMWTGRSTFEDGTDVYQDDIVQYDTEDGDVVTALVKWCEDTGEEGLNIAGFKYEPLNIEEYNEEQGDPVDRVIGNKFDNPELLNQDSQPNN